MSRIAFKNKAFTVDSIPRFIFSGEIQHYRLPAGEWRDRLEKMAALGLNGIGVYAGWNFHSPEMGIYDFASPDKDFGKFLDEAQRVGLHVLVRPGPYVCNEWDLGGFPGWLLRENPGDWRTGEKEHLKHCLDWYHQINQIIAPRQIDQGGTVILYQVENEHFWGDKELFDTLGQAARKDGITVPFIGNGGGSVNRCGSKNHVDGCDIYTNVYEQWRWRGWLELASRLAGGAPLMVVEYNAGWFGEWGKQPAGEHLLPSEWMLSLTRMFLGLGANFLNPFVTAAGITPVDMGSDHCCTNYFEDAAIAHWGGLGRKFYLLRLLAQAVESVNEALARSKPALDFWATDSGYVEGMLRQGAGGKFVVAVNASTQAETFRIQLPDGRHIPESGTLAIRPRVSQFHLLDIDCGNGVSLEYSTAQVLKFWRDAGKLNLVVYGEAGSAGHAMFFIGGRRVRVDFVCSHDVCVQHLAGESPVHLFAVSTEIAERTWFVQSPDNKTVALFGNLDLVRPQLGQPDIRAEIRRGEKIRVLTDGVALSLKGAEITTQRRADGMIEHVGQAVVPGDIQTMIGAATYRAEDYSWTTRLPCEGDGWKRIEACAPGREVITQTGVYQYAMEFHCDGELPEFLEFLGLSAAETVVFLNGRRVSVFPEKRQATFHQLPDYRLRIPAAGLIHKGKNILALTLTIIGRHNIGNPLFAGISHPIVLYRQRKEVALPEWDFTDFGGRKHTRVELDRPSQSLLQEIFARPWRKIDLSHPPAFRESAASDWLDVRCFRKDIDIPLEMKGRPLFLECGKLDDAWCYVNGKLAGRAYHQMSATFDLSEYANERSMQVVLLARYYWQPACAPSIVPRLVTADAVLPRTFLRREGTDGERGRYFDSPGDFPASVHPSDAQALWTRRAVAVDIPASLIAPLYVELDEQWNANAVIYWNGQPIGRYSIVGPDRRFYIPSGLLKKQNTLIVYIDGHAAPARVGGVRVGPFMEQTALSLQLGDGMK